MRCAPLETPLAFLLIAASLGCAGLGRSEPERKWFAFYPGPMRARETVAILCKESDGPHIATIRGEEQAQATDARYESWHFPDCIEAPPGRYELEVAYFSRDTVVEATATITETMESPVPTKVTWSAEAGAVYLLRAVLGSMAPLPGLKPRAPRESATTQGRWYTRTWQVEIARLASWDAVAPPLHDSREAWARYLRPR